MVWLLLVVDWLTLLRLRCDGRAVSVSTGGILIR
jgi:hypothetical protein